MNSFYMHFTNKNTNFNINLNDHLKLDNGKEWKVALADIQFPLTLLDVTKEQKNDIFYACSLKPGILYDINIEEGFYDPFSFATAINNQVSAIKQKWIEEESDTAIINDIKKGCTYKLFYNSHMQRFQIKVKLPLRRSSNGLQIREIIVFETFFKKILGYDEKRYQFKKNNKFYFGIESNKTFKNKSSLENEKIIYLLCNFVNLTFVNNQFIPLLKKIKLKRNKNNYSLSSIPIYKEFGFNLIDSYYNISKSYLQYIPCAKKSLQFLQFTFLDEYLKPLSNLVANNRNNILLTLHFIQDAK